MCGHVMRVLYPTRPVRVSFGTFEIYLVGTIFHRGARVYTASQCQIAFDSIRSLYVALYTLMLHFRTYIYTWAAREVSVITLLALASSECVNALISLTMNAYFSSRPLGKISHSTGLLIRARTINTNVIRYPTARFIHQ